MRNFRELIIWKEGMELAKDIYGLTTKLPETEKYGLRSQMTRAAVSIPSNIAEGNARNNGDFKRFLQIAMGSTFELETQILLMVELDIVNYEDISDFIDKIDGLQRKINAFIRELKTQIKENKRKFRS